MTEIAHLKAGLLADIAAAATLDALEALRVGALGKSGVVTALLKFSPMAPAYYVACLCAVGLLVGTYLLANKR